MSRDEAAVASAIRKQVRRDAGAGRLKAQSFYDRVFPGYEAVVAREYAEVAGAVVDSGPRATAPPVPARRDEETAPDLLSTSAPRAAPQAPAAGGERIGPYRVVKELGRGAQGGVFLAEDTRLPRRVALKVLAPGLVGSDQMRARFRREAAAVAKLDHPGICTVYEADVDGATPFIAMRLVEGRTLAQLIDSSRDGGISTSAVRTSV